MAKKKKQRENPAFYSQKSSTLNPKPLLEAQTPNTKLDKYNSCSNNQNYKPKKNGTAANPKLQNPKLEKMQQLHIHTYINIYIPDAH
jgi:hypothetical protein